MRDALATLVEIARRIAKLPPRVVLRTTLLGTLCMFAVCALGLGALLSALVLAEGVGAVQRPGEKVRWREAAHTLPLVVTWMLGWFVGIAAGAPVPDPLTSAAATLAASALLGVLCAPLRLASGSGEPALGDALVRALAALGTRPARLVVVGAVDGLLGWGLPTALWMPLAPQPLFVVGLLALSTLGSFVWPLAAYDVCVRGEAPLATLRAPRLRNVVLVLAPGLALASLATMVELARPLGAWHADDVPADAPVVVSREIASEYPSAPVELGTPSGLRVTATSPYVLDVATADGGGCGAIPVVGRTRLYPVTLGGRIEVRRAPFRGHAAFVLGPWRGATEDHGLVAFVDDEGVRLDDTLLDRFSVRVDRVALGLLSLAVLLVLALVIATLRSARTAAALGATPLASARDAAWVVLCGRVRLDGGRVRVDARGVHVEGDVSFEGGGRAIAVLPGTYAAGRLDASTDDGAEAFVVAPARALKDEGYRLAPRAEAELFGLGSIDDARARFLARDARRLMWLAVPACVALVAYAAWLALPP
jgi:hypothetical protein